MEIFENSSPARRAAWNGFAVIGFVTLIVAGIWLAIYSARYVPDTVNGIGAAAVSLSSAFVPKPETPATLLVVPEDASTTLPAVSATTTSLPSRTPVQTTPAAPRKPHWTPGTPVVVGGSTATTTPPAPHYYGLPDLAVALETVGYVPATATSSDAIVASTTIPAGTQIAVKFRVTNIGTNVSGPWTVAISASSNGTIINQTFSQNSLVPGQPSEYIARLGNITPGAGRSITITIDPNHQLTESNTANNVVTTSVTVLGS